MSLKILALTSLFALSCLSAVAASSEERYQELTYSDDGRNDDEDADPRKDKRDEYEKAYDRTLLGVSLPQYFKSINSGWKKNLSPLRKALKPHASYLVLQTLEPRMPMDLRSAENFRRGATSIGLINLANDSLGIGHVFLSWRCQVKGQMLEGSVGMTGEIDKQFTTLSQRGFGMSSFLAVFSDGHLQNPDLLDLEFQEDLPVHTFAMEVEPEVCQNALGFVHKFLFHPSRPLEKFGLTPDPEKFEGGGCGSFAVSVLNQSKIFGDREIIPNFWRTIHTKKSLLGYGLPLPKDTIPYETGEPGVKKVSLVKLFASNWNGDDLSIRIMDPEMVLLFLKTAYRFGLDDIYRQSAKRGRELLHSDHYKYRTFSLEWENGAPADIIFNKNFDPQAARLVKNSNAWLHEKRSLGYKASSIYVGLREKPSLAVIFDKRN